VPPAGLPVASPPDVSDEFTAELRAAVRARGLHLVYQPEFDLPTGRVVAVEALARWHHPRLGELGPEWFIPLAERTDLIADIGTWAIDTALAQLASWRAARPGLDLTVRVNVSPLQITGHDIAATVADALDRHGVPAAQVCVELTENAPLGDVDEVARALRRLAALGVSSAIDDFATGYSALSHLRTLPVDFVKIDRSLVAGIDADPRAQAIVTAVIGLAINFELGVIAEGVETEPEAATLLRLGCTRAQGHLFARAMGPEAVLDRLRDGEPARR
jgi:EAL domain-containing protein (putative c-di-GMP-specific phosphodiesterase class I)